MNARIAIDARTLTTPRSGIGRFLEGLLVALRSKASQHEYLLLADRPLRPELALEGRVITSWLPRQLWEASVLPRVVRRLRADVFYLPQEGFPGAGRGVRRVVTINDLIPLHFGQYYLRNRMHASWYRRRLCAVRRDADVIIANSQATADDVQEHLQISADRIRVVRIPVDGRFRIADYSEQLVFKRFSLERDGFFLAVGTAEPRKNLARVLEAHAQYARGRTAPKPLALFGHAWRGCAITDLIVRHGAPGLVRVVGGVSDEELVGLYNLAAGLVFPSIYEGYGLPVTEAMACGCPVVTANRGALAEVAGRAALLVDPTDVKGIADALALLHEDESQRSVLSAAGPAWARRESWSAAAQSVLEAYGLT